VDNLFVFLMTFDYFQVPLEHQGRVLTWGIVGAILMRGEHAHDIVVGFRSLCIAIGPIAAAPCSG